MNEIVYFVPDISTGHCRAAIIAEVGALTGVEGVDVDLDTKLVRVTGPALDDAAIRQAIEEAGYTAASLSHREGVPDEPNPARMALHHRSAARVIGFALASTETFPKRQSEEEEVQMSHAQQMLETHPRTVQVDAAALVACIDACFDCAQSCTACADGCLGEPNVENQVRCITTCQNCSDVCIATGRVLSRQTEFTAAVARRLVEACLEACRTCAEECERHAHHHEHCRVCAEACRRCEQACEDLLSALPS